MIVSQSHYLWFIALATGLSAGYWVVVDAYRLKVALASDRSDLAVRDRIVGSTVGVLIGLIGVGGVLHYLFSHDML